MSGYIEGADRGQMTLFLDRLEGLGRGGLSDVSTRGTELRFS